MLSSAYSSLFPSSRFAGGMAASLLLGAALVANAEDARDSAETARRLGLSEAAIERVATGEIVAENLEASSDKDLSMAVVMRVDASLDRVFQFIDTNQIAKYDTVTVSEGSLDPANPSLSEMQLPDEVLAALVEDPGDALFMSTAEAEEVATAAKSGKDEALDTYRSILAARARAYWENGIAGITPYAGKGRSPSVDLTDANEFALAIVENAVFRAELEAIPAKSPGKAIHKLSWAVEKGRDWAAPVLIHQILYRAKDGEIFLQRRFYSGYDYDALQILTGILPTSPTESTVLYTNHTYTAQVTGFGGSAKRAIGRGLLEKEIVAEMKRVQDAIAKE